jgi:hypothetical protein
LDTVRTAASWLRPGGLGLVTRDHPNPSQCRTKVVVPVLLSVELPTAQAFVADTACTPNRLLARSPGSGLGTTAQDAPFQCSIRVCACPLLMSVPTAQALHAVSTVTPLRSLFPFPGLGGCCPPVQAWQVAAEAAAAPGPASTPASISGAASAAATRPAARCTCI